MNELNFVETNGFLIFCTCLSVLAVGSLFVSREKLQGKVLNHKVNILMFCF